MICSKLLSLCDCWFGSPVFPALEAPLGPLRVGERNLDFFEAKDKLIALGLVDPVGPDRLSLHPVLGLGVQNAEPQAVESERQRTTMWLLDYAHSHQDDYDALERERANLLGLLDWFADERRWDEMVTLMRDLFNYLRVRGQWEEAFQRLQIILDAVEELTNVWIGGGSISTGGLCTCCEPAMNRPRQISIRRTGCSTT